MALISIDQLALFRSELIQQGNLIEVIVKYHGDIQRISTELNAVVEILSSIYAIITLPVNRIIDLYGYPEIEYVELPKFLSVSLRESISRSCISPVQDTQGLNLTGTGVIVGIIDSGIDYTHPDFINPDGTSRIAFIWDQTIPGNPPEGFRSGSEYTNDDINNALSSTNPLEIVPSTDTNGHGTAVSGIAAGNGRSSNGAERGVAPESTLIIVKLGYVENENFSRSTEIMRGIKYIVDKAQSLNMPVSINISYGTNDGSHDGSSLFETFIDSMCERWKTNISVATGNEGASGHHFFQKINDGERVNISFGISGNMSRVFLTLWKNFNDTMTVELITPSGKSTGIINPTQAITNVELDNVSISIIYGQPTHYNISQEVYFFLQGNNIPIMQGIWFLNVYGEYVIDGRINIWLPTLEDVSNQTAFLRPNPETTLTLPSTALNVITVGGYNSRINTSLSFSGRGFTRNNVFVKPDIVAPAENISTTKAGGGYDRFTGTSFAAPFVCGSAALMMEWGIVRGNDQFLYGQRIKAFLQKGARRDFQIVYPNPIWGYGSLSLCTTMDLLEDYTTRGSVIL